jgi:membrane associated rhomboid family serine protease
VVHLRAGSIEERFPETDWEAWVAAGRVPPDALVFSLEMTGGQWRRADTVELYHFFRQAGEEERREIALGGTPSASAPFAELPAVAFPRRGLSATELLLGANLLSALVFILIFQERYHVRIWSLSWDLYYLLMRRGLPVGFVATLFMHADLRHLLANMMALVPAAAFGEYLHGRRVWLIYVLGGIAGALASFVLKGRGPLSIGASGAVYALIGAFGGFVVRYHPRLARWHRWRARRVYVPLIVLTTLPAIFYADWHAHLAGFLSGVILGAWLPLVDRGRRLLLARAAPDHAPVA